MELQHVNDILTSSLMKSISCICLCILAVSLVHCSTHVSNIFTGKMAQNVNFLTEPYYSSKFFVNVIKYKISQTQ